VAAPPPSSIFFSGLFFPSAFISPPFVASAGLFSCFLMPPWFDFAAPASPPSLFAAPPPSSGSTGKGLVSITAPLISPPFDAFCDLFCLLFDAALVKLCSSCSRAAPAGASPTAVSRYRALSTGSTPLHSLHSLFAILSVRAVALSSHACRPCCPRGPPPHTLVEG
jgi:hypothetical protein